MFVRAGGVKSCRGDPHRPRPLLPVLGHQSGHQLPYAAVSPLVSGCAVTVLQTSIFLGPRDTQPGPSDPHCKLEGLLGMTIP